MENTSGGPAIGPGPVVVGVNGSLAGYRQALVFAAREARLRNSAIRLVHGCEPLATLTERQPPVPLVARDRQARRQLRDAAEALRPLLDADTTVEFRVDPRTGVDALLGESSSAELIVLQRRDVAGLGGITPGSTSNAVAARADCAVAVIRAGQGYRHPRTGVLVGIDERLDPDDAVRLAFTAAAARASRLTAIHVFTSGSRAEKHPSWPGQKDPDTRGLTASELAELLSRYAAGFPGVTVDHLVVSGEAVEVLADASESAEMLVVGRSHHESDAQRLGSQVRRLINAARCPLLVAAPRRTGARSHRR